MKILFLLLLSVSSFAQITSVNSSRQISQPDYNVLSGIQAIWDATGLKTGINNDYGSVSSTNNLLTWESLKPGPTGRDLTSTGNVQEAIKLVKNNGITVLDFNGERWLRHVGGTATWNYMHYNATFANIRWTVTMLIRPTYSSDPGTVDALFGNNGTSTGFKGAAVYFDDRPVLASANRRLSHGVTKGTAGAISSSADNNVIDYNEWHTYTFTYDASQSAANRFKAYKENTQLTLPTVASASTAVVTGPTYELEIMSGGNAVLPASGQLAIVVFQSVVESQPQREAFVNSLEPIRTALNAHSNDFFHVSGLIQDDNTHYYMPALMAQNPVTPNVIVRFYRDDTHHVTTTTSKVMMQKSTDYGLTWAAATTVSDPGSSPTSVTVGGIGYESSGRLWAALTYSDANIEPFECRMFYSDDNGDNFTNLDITSRLPADGLTRWQMFDNILELPNGRIGFSFYTYNGALTSSGNYFMYTDDDGEQAADWTAATIRAAEAAYKNEAWSVVAGNRLFTYTRDEATKEWNVFSSADWGTNWSDGGAVTLGENLNSPGPVSFSQFELYGVPVTAVWFPDRFNSYLWVAFARTSDLQTDPKNFDLDTKTRVRGRLLHYGQVIHPYNDFYSISFWSRENTVSPFGGENTLVSAFMGTGLKDLVLRELGITRQ